MIKKTNRLMLALIIWIIPAGLLAYNLSIILSASTGLSLFIYQLLAFGIPCLIVCVIKRKNLSELFPTKTLGLKNISMIAGMALLIQPLLMFISTLTTQFLPNQTSEMMTNMTLESNFILVLFFIAVVPSVFEELLFRGIIFSGYKNVPIVKIAIINGILFGIIHLNLHQFLYAVVVGFILCFFVYYTKSIIAPILAHFVINGTQITFHFWQVNTANDADPVVGSDLIISFIIIGIIALITFALFMLIYKHFKRHNIARSKNSLPDVEEITTSDLLARKNKLITVPLYIVFVLFGFFAFFGLQPAQPQNYNVVTSAYESNIHNDGRCTCFWIFCFCPDCNCED